MLPGDWVAGIGDKLGTGWSDRSYTWLRENHFLQVRHRSVPLPREQSLEGGMHEELGVFSFDGEPGAIVYRKFFMNEGQVVQST